jgi:hypothetical protein
MCVCVCVFVCCPDKAQIECHCLGAFGQFETLGVGVVSFCFLAFGGAKSVSEACVENPAVSKSTHFFVFFYFYFYFFIFFMYVCVCVCVCFLWCWRISCTTHEGSLF